WACRRCTASAGGRAPGPTRSDPPSRPECEASAPPVGPSRARESGRRPSARLQTARYTMPTVPPPWRNIDSSTADAPSPWKPFSWTIAQYVLQLSPLRTLRRLGCRRLSIKTSSANDTAQVTLVSALAHDWYLLCKPLARSRASQHGTRKTAAARLHLRVRRRQPAGKSDSHCNLGHPRPPTAIAES